MNTLEQHYPNWQELRIHESSPNRRGASERIRKECRDYIASQYFGDKNAGKTIRGFRNENLESLSFPDESLDLHITQDVFEHVFDPAAAFSEIARTLRPGGAHIFTVPLVNREKPTRQRAEIQNGEVQHLIQPEYHGNPISRRGSLVTFDWGFDIVEFIREASGLETDIFGREIPEMGIEAEFLEVLITKK